MAQHTVIVGVTRFSVDPSSIILQALDEEDLLRRRAAIYEPERLANRLALFTSFALPSLVAAAARGCEFFHLLAYSSELPSELRLTLLALGQRHAAWLRPIEVKPQARLADVVRGAVQVLAAGRPCFNFRIDDDDALRPEFVDAVVRVPSGFAPGTVLSFDLGYYVQRLGDGLFIVHERSYPKIAIGLGLFCEPRGGDCVFDLPVHNRIPTARVHNVRDRPYWLRTVHAHNDSGTRANAVAPMRLGDACELLAPHFGYLMLREALGGLTAATEVGHAQHAPKVLYHIQ